MTPSRYSILQHAGPKRWGQCVTRADEACFDSRSKGSPSSVCCSQPPANRFVSDTEIEQPTT